MYSDDQHVTVMCLSCGNENPANTHFCDRCDAPLTTSAVTDPFLSIRARGFAVRQAVNKPQRPIVVIGIWLWFGPVLILSLYGLGAVTYGLYYHGFNAGGLYFGVMFVFGLLLSSAILFRTSHHLFNRRSSAMSSGITAGDRRGTPDVGPIVIKPVESACLSCGEMMSNDSSRCGKCGWSFDETAGAVS